MNLKLKHLLNSQHIFHKTEIMKQPSLKNAHIYCKINNLSGQLSGIYLENYIQHHYNMLKIKNKLSGDLSYDGKNYEIKISNGGHTNKIFSYNQLRPYHNCDYILTAYHIDSDNLHRLGDLYIFNLNKINMLDFICTYGKYSQGNSKMFGKITKKSVSTSLLNYNLKLSYNDNSWKDLLTYRVKDIDYIF